MTLENMRYLLELNNKEILNRIQNLQIMVNVMSETGLGGSGLSTKELEELQTQIEDISVKIKQLNASDTVINTKIQNIIKNMESLQIDISQKEGNAISQQEDGIYVADKSSDIKAVEAKVNTVNKYQKYVNNELEYFNAMNINRQDTTVSLSAGIVPLTNFTSIVKNMEVIDDIYVVLKANKTYNIRANLMLTNTSGRYLYVITESNIKIGSGRSGNANYNPTIIDFIYTPTQDTNIALSLGTASTTYLNACYFSIQEINHEIVVDPVEYINDTQGIEDTPVGHVLSYVGNNASKHYLMCDGSEHNIFDYPYLAEHILNEFGSYNYFGGDGINTFAVPLLEETKKEEYHDSLPVMTNNTEPAPYIASCSSQDSTRYAYLAFNKTNLESGDSWESSYSDRNPWIQIYSPNGIEISKFSITNRNVSNRVSQYPKTISLVGSDDETNWTTLMESTELTWKTYNETLMFELDKQYNFKYIRLYAYSYSTYTDIGKFEIFHKSYIKHDTRYCIKYEPTYYMNATFPEEANQQIELLQQQNAELQEQNSTLTQQVLQNKQEIELLQQQVQNTTKELEQLEIIIDSINKEVV